MNILFMCSIFYYLCCVLAYIRVLARLVYCVSVYMNVVYMYVKPE